MEAIPDRKANSDIRERRRLWTFSAPDVAGGDAESLGLLTIRDLPVTGKALAELTVTAPWRTWRRDGVHETILDSLQPLPRKERGIPPRHRPPTRSSATSGRGSATTHPGRTWRSSNHPDPGRPRVAERARPKASTPARRKVSPKLLTIRMTGFIALPELTSVNIMRKGRGFHRVGWP